MVSKIPKMAMITAEELLKSHGKMEMILLLKSTVNGGVNGMKKQRHMIQLTSLILKEDFKFTKDF